MCRKKRFLDWINWYFVFFRLKSSIFTFCKKVKSVIFVFSFIVISERNRNFYFFLKFNPEFSLFWPKWPKMTKNHLFLQFFTHFCQNWHFKKWPFLRHFLTPFFWTSWGGSFLIGKTRAFSRIFRKPQKRVQKVVQKVVIFGTPKCAKWPKFEDFDGLPLTKSADLWKRETLFDHFFLGQKNSSCRMNKFSQKREKPCFKLVKNVKSRFWQFWRFWDFWKLAISWRTLFSIFDIFDSFFFMVFDVKKSLFWILEVKKHVFFEKKDNFCKFTPQIPYQIFGVF